ncbi:RDD family protein [Ferrimonas senticii]|uniref:RDD family protein n=1 Tax=Ferrimonas senticii TaxID=394566 RepID=UPI000415287B|nr:RDD family protein [Ferrimonas senticii]
MSFANAPRATLLRRMAAWMYDFLVGIAVYMFAGTIMFALITLVVKLGLLDMGQHQHISDLIIATPALSLVNELAKLLAVAYLFVWSWSRSGQTLGMRAWRIRVQRTDGALISQGQGWRRAAYAFGGLANLTLLWDSSQTALHDRLSGSEVVQLTIEQNKQLLEQSKLR